jgi:hypothetical protein
MPTISLAFKSAVGRLQEENALVTDDPELKAKLQRSLVTCYTYF